jgi:isocitrate dehydrogenase (NAD+)
LTFRCNQSQGTRNTGKSIAGQNIANPLAMLNASADMLEYLELYSYAQIIRDSIDNALNVEKLHTPDLGGTAGTNEVIDYIVGQVKQRTQI